MLFHLNLIFICGKNVGQIETLLKWFRIQSLHIKIDNANTVSDAMRDSAFFCFIVLLSI